MEILVKYCKDNISGVKEIETLNGKKLGTFELDSDGSYYFWQDLKSNLVRCWSSYSLRLIANELDKINKPFEDKVKEYFSSQKGKYNRYGNIEDVD